MKFFKFHTLLLLTSIFSGTVLSYDLPFNITPNGALPTSVPAGGTVNASYTIRNNATVARSGNFVKYLPPNVTQTTGTCSTTFNLGGLGSGTESCILNLIVSGPVDANDPDPHHHLFVCMSDALSCAGTYYPLNVGAGGSAPHVGIAAGEYLSTVGGERFLMSAARSQTSGEWAYVIDSAYPTTPPTGFTNAGKQGFVSASCAGLNCAISGSYVGANKIQFPLVAVSPDGGMTWAYKVDSANPVTQPNNYASQGVLDSASCSGLNCVAAGQYNDGTVYYPLAAESHDGGSTWGYSLTTLSPLSLIIIRIKVPLKA